MTQSVSSAPAASPPRARRRAVVAVVGVSCVVCIVAVIALLRAPLHARGDRRHGGTPETTGPTAKQLAALSLAYPPLSGRQPSGMTIEYDGAKDRTRMTLTLPDLTVSGSGGFRVGSVQLRLVSQFHGVARGSEFGESVVDGSISLMTGTPGALAVSAPVGEFTVDGRAIALRPASTSKPAYSSQKQPGGAKERIGFKMDTADFLAVASGRDVSARFGAVAVHLTPGQIDDIREFAARMKPGG